MSSSSQKNDVFISFRGEDTRSGFTSHLHGALEQQKIEAYIDKNLEKGEQVWPKLEQAIDDSLMSIVVFSENYASSRWCLEELVKIMECRKGKGLVVVPVFYETDPSQIRKQTGSYEKAITKHDPDLMRAMESDPNVEYDQIDLLVKKKVSEYKAALTEAANISGWDSRIYGDDAELVRNIVSDIKQKLHLRYPNELEGFVGIDKARRDIESLLENNQVIGIWGMGGIGKTTIAKVVFAEHFPQYESSCFLENIREESAKHGKTYLITKLIFNLLNEQIHSSDVLGSAFIKKRVRSLKVFIVLDDVDNVELLEYLYGMHGCLGAHSRLVITTRNKEMLEGRVDKIYELKNLNFHESLTLFRLNAFKKEHPQERDEHPEERDELSKKVVDYAKGVPLALKVLGKHIYNLKRKLWGDFLSKLKEFPDKEIQSVLKVSYDGLDKAYKDIFLDIAFFFKEEDKDYVIRMLAACGFHAKLGIDALVNKALIMISNGNRIQMHDLLQEMGMDIVREECRKDPGRRSRLMAIEEVCDVLQHKKGTDGVEGITLDLSQIKDWHLNADAFNMMINLRFLRFHLPLGRRPPNVFHPRVLKLCSNKLRYFEWGGYPLKSLPSNFCAELLVEFRMPHSNVKELWQRTQNLVNLEGIDLSECKQLMKLPDLSGASKLRWIYLSGCESLCAVYLTVDRLVTLILDGCKKLKSLKSEKHLPSLEKLSVKDCSSLKEFLVSSDLVERLDLRTTKIQILHSSIGRLPKLMSLNLEGLRLKNLPDELSSLKSLEELRISNCIGVIDKQKLHVLCDRLQSLRTLHLKGCNNLPELSENIKVLSKLNELRLDGSSVEKLPASIKCLQELEILSIKNCRKLWFLPELPPFIKEFYADNCTSLVRVSTLMAFAAKMNGKEKFISFKNCKKLDEGSLQCIMEGAQLTMMSAAFHNVSVRMYESYAQRYNYNTVEVCLAGSRVPKQFTYRTSNSSSITIQLPKLSNFLGFIYCVVLSSSCGVKKNGVKIQCQCYLADGTKVGSTSTWYNNATGDLNSDHVYAWYDPFHCDSILSSLEQHVCFEFLATTDCGDERDGKISMTECGVSLICVSDLDSCLQEQELGLKLELGLRLGLALDLMQRYAELESRLLFALENGLEPGISLKLEFESRRRAMLALIEKESNGIGAEIHNQEGDTSDKCSRSGDGLLGMKIFAFTVLAYLVLNKMIKKEKVNLKSMDV